MRKTVFTLMENKTIHQALERLKNGDWQNVKGNVTEPTEKLQKLMEREASWREDEYPHQEDLTQLNAQGKFKNLHWEI